MSITVVIEEQIEDKLGKATVDVINGGIQRAAPSIGKRLGELLISVIKQGRTYQSLVGGDLRYELGLENARSDMDSILSVLSKSVALNFSPFKYYRGKVTGSLSIDLLKDGFAPLLAHSKASYQSNQYTVNWLDWLLTKGDSVIILDHHIVFDLNSAQQSYSRTGDALMFPGGTWRVPPQFSGLEDSNFIIWGVESREFQNGANKIINEELKKVF